MEKKVSENVIKFEVVDSQEVPGVFRTVNESLIGGYISMCQKNGMPADKIVIPGVKITIESTGK